MKKIVMALMLCLVSIGFVISCSSNKNGGTTEADIRMQDSIRQDSLMKVEAQRVIDSINSIPLRNFKANKNVTIGYNEVTFSDIKLKNEFTFGSYDDYYSYRTSDRNMKYLNINMKVTSKLTEPKLPEVAIYSIIENEMSLVGVCEIEFARWQSHGTKIGLYYDTNNDFKKKETINFKLGVQVPDYISKDYAIVVANSNTAYRFESAYNAPKYCNAFDFPNIIKSINLDNEEFKIIEFK